MKYPAVFFWLMALIWILVLLGIVLINSVSALDSYKLMTHIHGDEYCQLHNCNGFYYWKHIQHVFLGIPFFLAGILVPIRIWKRFAMPLFVFVLGILTLLLVGNIGGNWGTANSWLNIPGLPSIQPSEMMKLSIIFYLAIWMDKKERVVQTWESGFLPFVVLMIPPVFLLALQPDFGSLLVIAAIAAVMFFVAGGNIGHILLGGALAFFLAFIPIMMADNCDDPLQRDKFCYISERITGFLGENENGRENYQVTQSLIAVGSGGVFGLGIGESVQRYGYLPEIQSDTIFAAAAEELGFLRIIFLVGIFAAIAMLGFHISRNARNRFEMLVAAGITAWITFQALINMAVVLKLFPVTGITLPFVSYGGSSMITLLFAAGILLRIAQFSSGHAHTSARRRIGRAHFTRSRRRF